MVSEANRHARARRRRRFLRLGIRCHQGSQSHRVVRGYGKCDNPVDQRFTTVAQFPQASNGLHPARHLLDELPIPLTDLVARVACGANVDGAVWCLARDVRGHLECADVADEARQVIRPSAQSDGGGPPDRGFARFAETWSTTAGAKKPSISAP